MKKLIYILLFTLLTLTGSSQTIKRGSINSIGFTSPNINFSVGQYTAGNYTSGTNKITVGFQQPVRIMLDTSVAIIGDLSICPGDTTTIKANSSPFYTWFKNDSVLKAKDTSLIKLTQKDTGVYKIAYTDGLGHYDSSRQIVITKSPYQKPPTPTIVRDSAGNLTSNYATGNQWYKDGVALTDTAQKIKPTTPGSFTVKVTQNGCISTASNAYYYIVTDVINLSSDEFIKLAPNPFINQLNFDFVVKGYQRLNLEVFDVATGSKVATQQNLTAGSRITLGQLSAGTYVIKITSADNKISYQFKMVKF